MVSKPCLAFTFALAVALAGCAAAPPPEDPAPRSAGARLAASAPSEPYEVLGDASPTTAYPLLLPAAAAKPPVNVTREGVFEPLACSPTASVSAATDDYHRYDLAEALEPGSIFSYEIQLRFNNTDEAWGDLHLSYSIGGRYGGNFEPTAEQRGEIVLNFSGQSYHLPENEAWVAAQCWHSAPGAAIPYSITATFVFSENVVPAETPFLFEATERGARLFVSGIPSAEGEAVSSHYRVFNVHDELVCECALNSNEPVDVIQLGAAGDYVVLVDHTAGGFVALALDLPPPRPLRALVTAWHTQVLHAAEGEQVDETLPFESPSVPLDISLWVVPAASPPVSVGGVRGLEVEIQNARGTVARLAHGSVLMHSIDPAAGLPLARGWTPLPLPGEWAESEDHHTFQRGAHTATVRAEWLAGQIMLGIKTYLREAAS